MTASFGLFHDARMACRALACLTASAAARTVGQAAATADRSAGDPPNCVIGSSAAGRGLYVTRPIAQREVILRDVAVVDSACSQDLISRIFSSQPPGESRSKREPIWGLVANFVLLLLQDHWYRPQMRGNLAALAGRLHLESGDAEAARSLVCRLDTFKAFYRPQSQDKDSSLYKQHADEMHRAMDPEIRRLVSSEIVADLLTVVRLDAHIVRARARVGENGLGLFFWLHLANHSCCPNAFFHTTHMEEEGTRAKVTLYALRPLDSGEQVCISYVDGQTLLTPLNVPLAALGDGSAEYAS